MVIQASAPRKGCITERCRRLVLKSDHEPDQIMMSALNTVVAFGGSVTIKINGKEEQGFRFPPMPWDDPVSPK
jgi:hypothetical protein